MCVFSGVTVLHVCICVRMLLGLCVSLSLDTLLFSAASTMLNIATTEDTFFSLQGTEWALNTQWGREYLKDGGKEREQKNRERRKKREV